MHKVALLLVVMLAAVACAASAGSKLSSLGISNEHKDLVVDAHYSDRSRTNLVIEAAHYEMAVSVSKPAITALMLDGRNVMDAGALRIESGGAVYKSDLASKGARLNIWRHGPYFYEIHLLNFSISTEDGRDFPGKGEIVFYCYPEKVHIQAIVRPDRLVSVNSAHLDIRFAAESSSGRLPDGAGVQAHVIRGSSEKHSIGVVSPSEASVEEKNGGLSVTSPLSSGRWVKGDEHSAWIALLPARNESSQQLVERVSAEVSPLPESRLSTGQDSAFEGYDPVRGHYVLRGMPSLSAHGFEEYWVSPNQYLSAAFNVRNDRLPRRIYVKHYTPGLGCLEAGVLTDRHGFPIPVPVQVCKNFAGENEEPDDTAFGESYFPLSLESGQSLDLVSLHLLQNWGNHPLKQISSIRFFEHYYHLSTGVTETTCYVPFTKFAHPGTGYSIADYRGMSGITWLGQPQHHHVALIGFLQYYDGEWHNLRYLNTKFDYISPNLARFTMNYMSDDGKIRASVDAMEIPQLDETRSFVRIRYDVLEPVEIQGDVRRNLRFVNANTDITRNSYQKVAYLDENNEVVEIDLKYDDTWALEGAALGKDNPFVAMYASDKSNNSFIVTRYEGRIGGKPLEHLGTSAVGYNNHVAEQFLTVTGTDGKLLPGDYLEADVILMPYGYDWHDWRVPNRERTYYGSAGPTVDVRHGEKIADFPAEVRSRDGYAEFKLSGGHDYLPFIVKGLPHHNAPMLWERTSLWNFIDQQVRGNDWYQVVPGGDGFDFVFLTRQRNGMSHHYLVTQAWSEHGLESVRGENGEAVVKAIRRGRMEIASPRLFADLTNSVRAGSTVVRSTGIASEARSLPILATASAGSADITVKRVGRDGCDIDLSGSGKVKFTAGFLKPMSEYVLTRADASETVSTDKVGNAAFEVDLDGRTSIKLRAVR